jgi:hypothetical protein
MESVSRSFWAKHAAWLALSVMLAIGVSLLVFWALGWFDSPGPSG